jgi:hypothetical protein
MTDLHALERRLRRGYELARLRSAAVAFAPMLLIVALGVVAGRHHGMALSAAAALVAIGVGALWYGRQASRGVLLGAISGSTALILVICAKHFGHACAGDHCMSWCVPACVGAGVLAGALVGAVGGRAGRRGLGFWATASAITVLTGALGCSCVGHFGAYGLAVGFGVALALTFVIQVLRRGHGSAA